MEECFGVHGLAKLIHAAVAFPSAGDTGDGRVVGDPTDGDKIRVWSDKVDDGQREVIAAAALGARNQTNDKGRRYRSMTADHKAANR